MERKTVTVKDPDGIHLRVAAKIVNASKKYNSKISLSCRNCPYVDASSSIIGVLLLQATKGTSVTINAEGSDEKKAVEEISRIFINGAGI